MFIWIAWIHELTSFGIVIGFLTGIIYEQPYCGTEGLNHTLKEM